MKGMLRKIGGIRWIILTVYLWLVLGSSVFVAMSERDVLSLLLSVLITLIPATLASAVLIYLLDKVQITPREKSDARMYKTLWFLGFALVGFGVLMIYYRGLYPGGFTEDSVTQYTQAVTGKYNNWHPVLQTLFMFTLPLKLSGGWSGSVILFQMICFSLCAAYLCSTVLEYGNRFAAAVSFLFLYLNPVTGIIMSHAWKDPSFAIAAMLCMTFSVRIYYTDGAWLTKWYHILFTVIAFTACSIFRHNGFFFTLPLLLAIVLTASKRVWITVCSSVLVLYLLICGPLYTVMGVEKPNARTSESVGLPIAVIGEIAAHHPERMDDDLREFAYKVASPEIWEKGYVTGVYNSIKFSPAVDKEVMDEYGFFRIVGLMFKAFAAEPKAALKAAFLSTDMVYNITDDLNWLIFPYIARNSYEIEYGGDRTLFNAVYEYNEIFRTAPLRGIFWMLGTINLLVVASLCARIRRNKSMWRKLLIAGSMLVYNFGTMLILSGSDFRFFYYSYAVLPLVLLILFRKEEPEEADTADIAAEMETGRD